MQYTSIPTMIKTKQVKYFDLFFTISQSQFEFFSRTGIATIVCWSGGLFSRIVIFILLGQNNVLVGGVYGTFPPTALV